MKYASPRVNHLYTDQYAVFLYYLSNTLNRRGNSELASKAYIVNKALSGADLFYEVELPEIFAVQHPVGTVLGRGKFANHMLVYQRCSVGANLDNVYPTFREGVVMYGGSAVIGKCEIGPNTWLSIGTTVMDQDVPGNCVVFGRSPNLVIKPTKRNVQRDIFKVPPS
jgi:serine O-acetyltransferase